MVLSKRYCVQYLDDTVECFRDGFWYTDTGITVKWAMVASLFLFFFAWFLGGYLHAKARLRKGKPLLAYHRWLVSYPGRKRYGQTPQAHYAYSAQQPHAQQQQAYGPRADGTWPEQPPMYNDDAPPGYVPAPGAAKMRANQGTGGVEMGMYPAPAMGTQQTTVVGGAGQGQEQEQGMPPRPAQAKLAKLMERFRR